MPRCEICGAKTQSREVCDRRRCIRKYEAQKEWEVYLRDMRIRKEMKDRGGTEDSL